jgi:hypothetical protein
VGILQVGHESSRCEDGLRKCCLDEHSLALDHEYLVVGTHQVKH